MTVSIIIAVKTWQKNLEECVGNCRELNFSDFEIIILPDSYAGAVSNQCMKIIPTDNISPPKKRDIGIKHAQGEICAFIDDDAYPQKDWLVNALENFRDKNVAAVGGPAVTPPEDSLRQKASGIVYSSFFVSGKYAYRYMPKVKKEVDDYPSCNFLVRKSIMQELGGFDTNFWPGEDTKLCLDITKRLGKKIIYDPRVLVWHHRRPLFLPHLRQIASYALHRGYFTKHYPKTSLRFSYFIPTLFILGLLGGICLSAYSPLIRTIYMGSVFLYFLIVFISSIPKISWNFAQAELKDHSSNLPLFILVFFGIILTHLTYGIYFIKGLLAQRLPEEESG